MSNRSLFTRAPMATLVAAVVGLSAASPAAAESFRFGHVFNTSHPMHACAVWAAEQVQQRTGGRHTIQVFPDSTLGNETALGEAISLGGIDMMFTGAFFAGNAYGPAAIGNAPFGFRDLDHWKAFARGSDLLRDVAEGYAKASGNTIIGATYYGTRHVTANRPVTKPEDLRGVKIRVPNAKAFVTTFRALGANPTPLPFPEVYLALQQGVVDAQENPLPTIQAMKFHEVQKVISLTGHIMETQYTIMANGRWNRLSSDDKALFRSVYEEAASRCTDDIAGQEEQLAKTLSESGTQIVSADRAAFRTVLEPLLVSAEFPWGAEIYRRLAALR